VCKNKRNISFYKQFLDFFDVLTPLKLLPMILVIGRLGFYAKDFLFICIEFTTNNESKRNFHFYRILITLLFWGLTPTVLLADPPPPPPDEPIDDYLWFLVLVALLYVGYYYHKNKPFKV
jgi:hypothetical protein